MHHGKGVRGVLAGVKEHVCCCKYAAKAYQQIGGTTQLAVPEQKSSYQKDSFFATLPTEFTTGECVKQAHVLGASEKTARRWMAQWIEDGILMKVEHGLYQKCA